MAVRGSFYIALLPEAKRFSFCVGQNLHFYGDIAKHGIEPTGPDKFAYTLLCLEYWDVFSDWAISACAYGH